MLPVAICPLKKAAFLKFLMDSQKYFGIFSWFSDFCRQKLFASRLFCCCVLHFSAHGCYEMCKFVFL